MPDTPRTVKVLREQAARCRRLAYGIWDSEVERRLLELADEFDARAAVAEASEPTPKPGCESRG